MTGGGGSVGEAGGSGPFLAEVIEGLRRPRKTLPCKYFYDAQGSALFERICDLPEYYLTRTELEILRLHIAEMAGELGPELLLIEYGSGSGKKTLLLLDHLEAPAAYVPIDISESAMLAFAGSLRARYPSLEVLPVCADYTRAFTLPRSRRRPRRRAVFFPGSTIGNFTPQEAVEFLARARRTAGEGGALLIGVDLRKERSILEAAYDDPAGVTAAFNLNLLARINRELGGDFRLEDFRHRAFFDERLGRVEMHLVSRRTQTVRIAGEEFSFGEGESIHTECCYKYAEDEFAGVAARAGWTARRAWSDPARLFSVLLFSC